MSDRWETKKKLGGTTKRNPVQLAKDTLHKVIFDHGVRKRYNEFKNAVLQVSSKTDSLES